METVIENKKPRMSDDPLYNILNLDVSELPGYPTAINDIHSRKIDGMLIRGVLSEEEVNTILSNYKNVEPGDIVHRPEIAIYPRGFAAYYDEEGENLENYFKHGQKFNETFPGIFKVDLEARFRKVFGELSNGLPFAAAPAFNGVGSFAFSQIRNMKPNHGALPLHCGNVFQAMYEDFYADLKKIADIRNQMSFFVMLQQPDMGGELTLYDIIYELGQKMIPFDEMSLVDGKVVSIHDKDLKRKVLNPMPGDMIIFSAGPIWHKVEAIVGSRDRVTVGGFFAFSLNHDAINSWA